MASKTGIANRAALKLGQPRVSNIDTDSSVVATTFADMWDQVRDALLQAYPWNFAIKRTVLSGSATTTDEWGWDYKATIPSDMLQLLEIEDSPDYQVENGKILSDEASLSIRYIARIETTNLYPPLFCELLAFQLAIEGCERIVQDLKMRTVLMQEMQIFMEKVLSSDAIENPPVEQEEDTWITVRS